jgi:hypothetical protein
MNLSSVKEKPMHTPSLIARILAAALLLASFALAAADYTLETVADGLHHPWSVVQLPDGDFLVTERRGTLLHIAEDGTSRTTVTGVPDTWVAGQGGFLISSCILISVTTGWSISPMRAAPNKQTALRSCAHDWRELP